jgi:signal peptidase I
MRRKLLAALVDVILVSFVLSLLLSTAVQRFQGQAWGWIGIHGTSMHPTLADGALALSLPAKFDRLSVGDIVVFRSGSQPPVICHRIIGRTDNGFNTQGDGAMAVDQEYGVPAVTEANLAGIVPQIGGRPVSIPVLGNLAGGGENRAGPNLVAALGLSVGFLVLGGGAAPRRRRTQV